MASMNFPSRGLRESAMTIRYDGCFFRPVRRRRILTANGESSIRVAETTRAPRALINRLAAPGLSRSQVPGLRSQVQQRLRRFHLRPGTRDPRPKVSHRIPNILGLNFPPPPPI